MRSRLPVLGVLIGAGVLPVLLLTVTGTQMVMFIPVVHIVVVGTAGLAAAVAATALSIIGARRNDGRAVWTGWRSRSSRRCCSFMRWPCPTRSWGPTGSCRSPER